jgi:uncharacterized protein
MNRFLEYARRGNNAWWRYVATPVLALLLALLLTIIADPWIERSGLLPHDVSALAKSPSNPVWYYGMHGFEAAFLLACLIVSLLVVHNKNVRDIVGNWDWGRVATGAGAGLLLCLVTEAVEFALRPGGFQLVVGPQTATLALVAIPFVAIGGFFVEFLASGYWAQGLLLATKRPLVAALIVGVFGMEGAHNWPQAVGGLGWGIASALIAIRTGGIAMSWGLSVANNLFCDVVVVNSWDDGARGSPGIFTQTTPDLFWLDTAITCVLLAAICLWVVRRYPESQPIAEVFA